MLIKIKGLFGNNSLSRVPGTLLALVAPIILITVVDNIIYSSALYAGDLPGTWHNRNKSTMVPSFEKLLI